MSYRVRVNKRDQRRRKKIELPVDTQLEKSKFKGLKYVFVVDLSSYSHKKCNALLHQLLYGTIKDSSQVKVVVVMKAKFSPACICGVGDKNDTNFYKHRFITESEGRIVVGPTDRKHSSKIYCSEVINYLIGLFPFGESHNHVFAHSEDYIDSSCTLLSLITPEQETEHFFEYFDIGIGFNNNNNKDTNDNNNNNESIENVNSSNSSSSSSSYGTPRKTGVSISKYNSNSTPIKKQNRSRDSHNNNNGYTSNEMLEKKVSLLMEKWLLTRLNNEIDSLNLPKSRTKLENTIKKFCKISKKLDIQPILLFLSECGDISLCKVCQTCKPANPGTTSYYYTRSKADAKMMEHCKSMMAMIDTIYTNNHQTPITLTSLTHSTFVDSIQLDPAVVVQLLIESDFIKVDDQGMIISYSNQKVVTASDRHDDHTMASNQNQNWGEEEEDEIEEEIDIQPERVDYSFFV